MKTVGEILKLSANFLDQKKVSKAKRISEDLLSAILGMKRLDLYMNFDKPVEEKEMELMRQWLKRASLNEPVDYIIGNAHFYDCVIGVDRNVLIPRKETEEMVELALKQIGEKGSKSLLDLCTGSGCIAIAIKKKMPELLVQASDISENALLVAKKNAEQNGVQINFYHGDLLTPLKGEKFDCIVCNPPYVKEAEYEALEPSVRDYEPKLALVAERDGLAIYERLSQELVSALNPGGIVLFEIGASQGKEIQKIFCQNYWKNKQLISDLAGRDRFFFLEIQ